MGEIRKTIEEDLPGLKDVLASSELFPPEYLDDMISDYLTNQASEEIWFTCLQEEKVVGLGYCVPEKFTEGTYNLLAIGVNKEMQGQGIGKAMIGYIEDLLRKQGERILIVETSGDSAFQSTRAFYKQLGYRQEATIQDFWKEGEDKIIFWKKLNKN